VKRFSFKLHPLLKLRTSQRDVCQQLLADVVRHDDALISRRRLIESERVNQIDELRALNGLGKDVDVHASASRRIYTAHLTGSLGQIDDERAVLAGQIETWRQALVRADQAVKALERLAEKQQVEFVYSQERVEARILEDAWQATHAGEYDPC
jgi:flagellar export protein FliJ